ncbi:hypothetical protein NZK32_08565 [Cyanobium sp. FGCU-52]|jgi:hypothetical protein|nr:hypothetical protein [Cyanobium sp. FGCU52]
MTTPDRKESKPASGNSSTRAWLSPTGAITAVALLLVAGATWQWGLPRSFKLPGGFELGFEGTTPAGGGDITRVISRKAFAGRWQVEQNFGPVSGSTIVNWNEDGTFEGMFEQFQNSTGAGQRVHRAGTWDITKVDSDRFRLVAKFDDGETWASTFQVLGPDKIENKDYNYVAIRLPR